MRLHYTKAMALVDDNFNADIVMVYLKDMRLQLGMLT